MKRVYEFAIKLQDMFSPQMQRMASMYDQKISWMGRAWNKFTGMLDASSQTVSSLRGKLAGLAAGFGIKLDSSPVDKASGKVSGLLTKLKSLAGQSAIIGGLVGGGISGGVMGVVDMVVQSIGYISEKTVGAAQSSQSTRFTLDELMGKENAGTLVKNIDTYAPEKRDQLLSGAQKLSGSGIAGEKLMDTLKYLNNISALTGSKVEDLAMIQSQIKSTGYVQGDEINRFKERGINLNPYLAQTLKIGEGDIAKAQAKGMITYDIFDQAMQKYAGKGSKYENVYERKMMSTTEGREELVSGKVDAKLRGIGEKMLPIKDSILGMFNDILDGTGPIVAIFERMWGAISPVFNGIVGLAQSFGLLNEQGNISQGVFSTATFLFEYLGNVFTIIEGVVWGVSKAIEFLINNPVTMLIVGIYAASKAWLFLNAAFIASPIGFIVAGLVAVVAAVMYAWDKFDGFRNGVLKTWEVIKSVFSNIGGFLKAIMTGDVMGAIAIVGSAVSQGLASGQAAVNEDRLNRLNERRAGRKSKEGKAGMPALDFNDKGGGAGGGGSLADASGLKGTVGNSKSSSVIINVRSLIEKSELTVMQASEGIEDLESKLVEMLLRVANSGTRAITA